MKPQHVLRPGHRARTPHSGHHVGVISNVDAAAYLATVPGTLANWRSAWRGENTGPSYLRIGRTIYYRIEDLDEFLLAQLYLHPGNKNEQMRLAAHVLDDAVQRELRHRHALNPRTGLRPARGRPGTTRLPRALREKARRAEKRKRAQLRELKNLPNPITRDADDTLRD